MDTEKAPGARHENGSVGPTGPRLNLTESEIDAIAARLRAGESLDERYRPLLFQRTREAELAYTG
jgi:hypothetical protein